MGSDNLFHKRKARKIESLRRARAKRAPYDMVLIVCEGGKTEPNYFLELRDALQLNTANIEICGKECGSSPKDVVDFALQEYKANKDYDRVYCVFDKDQHQTYNEALDRVRQTNLAKGHKILAITSVPCFEFWFLLHFGYTTKGYVAGQGSICAQVIKDLKQHIPGYEKGIGGIYRQILLDKTDTAVTNAKKLSRHNTNVETDNPSTKVHQLVEYLRTLSKS
jgi:hypothetical protein